MTLDSQDSPRPGLGGSHHLTPYSILCITPLHLHPNDIFSWDSQWGVPKLFRFGLLGLWQLVTPCSNLLLGWGLKQTCSSPQELSNGVSHLTCTYQGWVDSWLLVVGSQIVSLTLDPSFVHNLCCKCLNGSCEAIFNIYASIPFQRYKEHLKARCFDPWNRALRFWESWRTPKTPFRECECHPHTPSKWGCDKDRNGFNFFHFYFCPKQPNMNFDLGWPKLTLFWYDITLMNNRLQFLHTS